MRAVLCKAFGPPDTLVVEEIASRPVSDGEVKIAVHAAGLNFPDILMIQRMYQIKPSLPFTPGMEIAGEVIETGAGVDQVQVGDRVIAVIDYGGFAEEVIAPVASVFPIPDSVSYEHGAGFSLVYGTSHVALTQRARLKRGETLLVLGAAGGVGLTAVELGKLMGATVIAAASTPKKLLLAQEYGADHIIDYTEEELSQRVKDLTGKNGVNVIYDPVGGDLFDQAVRRIAWEGRYLVIGFAAGRIPELAMNIPLLKNASIVGTFWGAYLRNQPQVIRDSFETLFGWYEQGRLRPHIYRSYPMEQVADAMSDLTERRAMGKVIIKVRD